MSKITLISKTQKLSLERGASSFNVINAGPQGPTGVPGPSEASLVLTVDGQILTRAVGNLAPITRADLANDAAFASKYPTVLNHGATAGTARSTTSPIFWIGSVDPTNATNNDELYRTDQTAKYVRVSGTWVEIGSSRFAKQTLGAGAPSGTGSNGDRYYDTTNDRAYLSDGVGWIITYEPPQTTTTACLTGFTGGTPTYSTVYKRANGRIAIDSVTTFTTAPSTLSNPIWTPPVSCVVPLNGLNVNFLDSNAGIWHDGMNNGGALYYKGTNSASSGASLVPTTVTLTAPFVWASSDNIRVIAELRMTSPYT